jgi:uncharacterized cupin superfamily protein
MPKVDLDSIEPSNKTGYPAPFSEQVRGRWWKRIAPLGRLTEMGASHVTLDPGAWSSQRHWHDQDDELLIMLSGTAVLVEDDGETELKPGDIAAWPKGDTNGHHLINRSSEPCTFVAISAGPGGAGGYSDIDMMWTADGKYVRKDGTPY